MISLNHDRKISDHALKLWRDILQRNPRAGLIIVSAQHGDAAARGAFTQRLHKLDFPSDRVSVVGRLPLHQFMNLSAVADFALDSYPNSGGATTFHCLAMGLPVLTIRPQEPVALYAYTSNILDTLGIAEGITHSEQDYVDAATQWIENPSMISKLRTRVRDAMRCSPYADGAARTADLEAAYLDALNRAASH